MAVVKTASVPFRIRPETKAILRQAAKHETRHPANRLEVMIQDWSHRHRNGHLAYARPSEPN